MEKLVKAIVLLVSLTWGANAYAVACTSAGTGNWGQKKTWGTAAVGCAGAMGGVPGAADTVTIANTHNVTANAALTVGAVTVNAGGTLTIGGGGASNFTVNGSTSISGTLTHTTASGLEIYAGPLTINAGGIWDNAVGASVTLRGGLTSNGTFTTGTTDIYTFDTTAAQSVNCAAPLTMPSVTVTAPTVLTNNCDLTVSTALAGTGSLTNSAAGILNIGGTSAIATLTASAIGNTVNYTGAAQTVIATAYHHLGLAGGGLKTMAGVTAIAANLDISGTATMTGNAAFTVSGALNYSSTGATTLTAATPISIGSYNQTAGSLIDNGSAITVTGTGASAWTQAGGTFTPTGTVILTGAAPQIGTSNFNNLTISVGSTATLTGNATLAGDLAVSSGTFDLSTFTADRAAAGGVLTISNGATLNIGGTNGFPANYAAHAIGASSTVEYSGTIQTVSAETYGNLTVNGSGTATLAGNAVVGGTLTLTGGTFAVGANTLTLDGPAIAGTSSNLATTGSSSLSFGGSSTGVFVPASVTALNNLTVNNINGVALNSSPALGGILTLTSGIITTGANILEVSSGCATAISGGGAASYVLGNLRLHYPTNAGATTCTFPIGDAAAYVPATVAITNVTSTLANSSLTARTDPGDHADTTAGASGIDAAKSVNRLFTLTPGASLSFATYDTTLTFVAGDVDGGANTAVFIVGRKNGGSWNYPVLGTKNPTDITATGMTQAGGFGEFVIGERVMPSITLLKAVAVHSDPVNLLVNPKFIPGAVGQYTVIASNAGGPADNNLTFITDPIPANTLLYVNDIGGAGSGPVLFTQGAASSTLTYTFTALGDMADDVSFSNDGGATWTAVPVADAFGCDATVPAITHIRVNPKGSFAGSAVAPNPSFQLTFRVCVQ